MSLRQLLELHYYTDAEEEKLVIINVVCSSFSFIGALFIMFNYLMFSEFQQNFAFKLIFCVAIGDAVTSIANFFGNPENSEGLCILQGMLSEAGALTSICWVTSISLSIWLIISAHTPPSVDDTVVWLKRMHIIIWSYIFICTVLPLTTNSYGPAGGWCWLKGEKDADNVWRFILFYIPLWLSITFMTFVYCKVWNKLSATAQQSKQSQAFIQNEDEESMSDIDTEYAISDISGNRGGSVSKRKRDDSSKSSTLQRMRWYPMVLMICYTPATVRRVGELLTSDQVISPFWLAGIQIFFGALIGIANALVYGLSQRAVRNKDKEWVQRHCVCCYSDRRFSNPKGVDRRFSADFGVGPQGQTEVNFDDRI